MASPAICGAVACFSAILSKPRSRATSSIEILFDAYIEAMRRLMHPPAGLRDFDAIADRGQHGPHFIIGHACPEESRQSSAAQAHPVFCIGKAARRSAGHLHGSRFASDYFNEKRGRPLQGNRRQRSDRRRVRIVAPHR